MKKTNCKNPASSRYSQEIAAYCNKVINQPSKTNPNQTRCMEIFLKAYGDYMIEHDPLTRLGLGLPENNHMGQIK